MTAPLDALSLSVNFNDGTGVVALQMTYTWVGPTFGESLPAPIATLTAPTGASLWSVHYATSEAAPADAYGGQFYLRQGTGDPMAPTWGPWILWVEEPASAWSGGFSSTLTVPAALTPPDTLLAVDPPSHDQYQSSCLDCVDSGPILLSRSSGTPSWARYLVAYTWVDAAGQETRAQTVSLDSASLHGGVAASTSTWQPREKHFAIIPAGAAAARWYVKPPLDTSDPASALAGWLHAADVPVVAGTLADWTLSVADAGTWPAAALPALNATCRAGWLRLSHASGQSYIQQNGMQVQMRAGSIDVLDLPLPVLPGTPATLVGRDPATGLPAFCPAPVPTTTTVVLGGGAGAQPAAPTACVQVRCGVSATLMAHLLSLYADWARWLDPLFQTCATLGVAVAVATIPWDWIADLGLGEAGLAIKGGIVTLLNGFVGAITGNLLPSLDPDMQRQIQQAAFDTLDCTGDQVQVSAADITAWQAALAALTTWPISSLAGPFCGLLLQYTPLAAWQGAAAAASPSHACDAWA